ncbi:hypothetical protein AVEN_96593-1 [Araneus ventricosus]|uniref:RNase H type-1 domain-containing protein n=1 Tax=Araneus ventricosus TaxID=182803 RepID=A0A4Y2SAN6_ARAVE|nr:hypothetical protein AVEN_96593-1 [Araneus ventricosus]
MMYCPFSARANTFSVPDPSLLDSQEIFLKSWYLDVPIVQGIPGNERADKAAKSANASREAFVPLIDALQAVKLSQHRVWQRIWDGQSNNKLYKIQPSIKGFGNLTIRKHDVILTRLRVGHTFLTHRHLLHSDPAPICNGCN